LLPTSRFFQTLGEKRKLYAITPERNWKTEKILIKTFQINYSCRKEVCNDFQLIISRENREFEGWKENSIFLRAFIKLHYYTSLS
jgi:hypothetical protein